MAFLTLNWDQTGSRQFSLWLCHLLGNEIFIFRHKKYHFIVLLCAKHLLHNFPKWFQEKQIESADQGKVLNTPEKLSIGTSSLLGNEWNGDWICYQAGPVSKSVIEKGLVKIGIGAKEIITHNQAYFNKTSENRISHAVLGYVTPVCIYLWLGHLMFHHIWFLLPDSFFSGTTMVTILPKYLPINLNLYPLFGCKWNQHPIVKTILFQVMVIISVKIYP